MKSYFLHKNKSKELILFFSGFASHYSHFKHLDSNIDIVIIYDYRDFNLNLNIDKYNSIILVAYSMGVCIAPKIFTQDKFSKTIALNGTTLGIHKEYGINPTIFRHTIKNLNITDFKKAIFGDNERKAKDFIFRGNNILKEELQSIYDFCTQNTNNGFKWDKTYISNKDSLFKSQICNNFFLGKSRIYELNTWHYPFFMFNTWEEICNIN